MTLQRPTRLAIALATAALIALVVPGVILGHAELDTVTPADKATVVGSPAEVVMTFTEHLDPAKSNIKLVNAASAVVAEASTVDTDRLTMRLPVPATIPAGVYTARWTSFSTDDNEQDRGVTTFTVTAATPPPTIAPTATTSASAPSSPAASAAPSVAPSVAPSPSTPPTSPAASTTDALIPIVVVLIAIVALGLWLLRGRSRRSA